MLVRFSPVASDMREVISAMKVSANLERIADHSVTIARRAKSLNDRPNAAGTCLAGAALSISHNDLSR